MFILHATKYFMRNTTLWVFLTFLSSLFGVFLVCLESADLRDSQFMQSFRLYLYGAPKQPSGLKDLYFIHSIIYTAKDKHSMCNYYIGYFLKMILVFRQQPISLYMTTLGYKIIEKLF